MITATKNNTDNTSINRTKITRKRKKEDKQMYGHFKWETNDISREKNLGCAKIGNLKSKTDFFSDSSKKKQTKNNDIRANYIKERIDKTKQNGKCIL